MRIAITNDMALAVEALRRVVVASGEHEVAWVARDGAEAVQKCREDRPDLILMDLVMPGVDGVEATRAIMAESPCAILIVTSSVSRMAPKVFEALGAGALDAIKTPVLGPELDGTKLLAKIRQIRPLVECRKPPTPSASSSLDAVSAPAYPPLVVIGASSGGPAALGILLKGLPDSLLAAVLLAQHIDFEFVPGLIAWLSEQSNRAVTPSQSGQQPHQGQILMASTVDHLCLARNGRLGHRQEPVSSPYRPSIDVLMQSVAENWRGPALGVILTGMGADGADGLLAMRQAGHHTIAQDQESSAIYGMPKAAAEKGAAAQVLPLEKIGPAIGTWLTIDPKCQRRTEDALI